MSQSEHNKPAFIKRIHEDGQTCFQITIDGCKVSTDWHCDPSNTFQWRDEQKAQQKLVALHETCCDDRAQQ